MDNATPPSPPNTPPQPATGLERIVRAAGYSRAGLATAWHHEAAFRQEVALACVLLPLAWWVGRTWLEVALLSACVMAVLVTELLNSAIENVVDLASPTLHPLAKNAKDIGSAAVFVALACCALVWGLALWSRFL
jgi:diacylglycerol kinase (ATP)